MTSKHWETERNDRRQTIKDITVGNVVKAYRADRHDPRGAEIHQITDTAIIKIYNENTKKLITMLIARPGQIQRYFQGEAPRELLELARQHQKMRYNEK